MAGAKYIMICKVFIGNYMKLHLRVCWNLQKSYYELRGKHVSFSV